MKNQAATGAVASSGRIVAAAAWLPSVSGLRYETGWKFNSIRGTERMSLAEIFRAAALEVSKGRDFPDRFDVSVCMCDALFRVADMRESLYKPAGALLRQYIGDDAIAAGPESYRWGKNFGDTPDEIRKCREVALLFMAAMVEADDA